MGEIRQLKIYYMYTLHLTALPIVMELPEITVRLNILFDTIIVTTNSKP